MSWWPKKTVVVPVDFSEESFAALDQALEMVDEPSHVHVVHVLVDLPPNEPGVVWGVVNNVSRIQHLKQAFAQRLTDEKYKGVKIEVLLGDAGHEIADYAKDIGADLIVLPSHGRTGLKRLVIGSVAERVARLAHCPVLILRK
jgi:nucleotide-binding universal stress UspA family protein